MWPCTCCCRDSLRVLTRGMAAAHLQVVPSIILSVFSAGAGIAQLVLTGSADLLEPAVNGLLALTETGKDKVRGHNV